MIGGSVAAFELTRGSSPGSITTVGDITAVNVTEVASTLVRTVDINGQLILAPPKAIGHAVTGHFMTEMFTE